jgi:hypothetical protein
LIEKKNRGPVLSDPEGAMKELSEVKKGHGQAPGLEGDAGTTDASFSAWKKLARTKGVSNPEMVAHFRGETLEQFLKTRRVPGAR